MNTLRADSLRKLGTDTRGLTTVEYVIALALIAAVGVATWQSFGSQVHDHLVRASNKINDQLKTAD